MKPSLQNVFGKKQHILIGMIHLPPLLSMTGFLGMKKTVTKALADLAVLEKAGFDGALIENNNDKPHTEYANEAQIACLTTIAHEVCSRAHIPIGVQMMLNDWRSSFAIAKAVGARFTRLDVFVDEVSCEWGTIIPNPKEISVYKQHIYPELLLLTDIQVKHKTMLHEEPLTSSAKRAVAHGSHGLIITGSATGVETPLSRIQEVRTAFPHFPVFVGAGVHAKNVREQLTVANGAIVGTSIQTNGKNNLAKALQLRKKLPH